MPPRTAQASARAPLPGFALLRHPEPTEFSMIDARSQVSGRQAKARPRLGDHPDREPAAVGAAVLRSRAGTARPATGWRTEPVLSSRGPRSTAARTPCFA